MNISRIDVRNMLIILIGFSLPIFPKVLLVLLLLLLLEWLINPDLKKNFRIAVKAPLPLLFMSLYLLYIIGLFYSSNLSYGIADLEAKLPLLVFPLIFSIPGYISPSIIKKALTVFIVSNFMAFIICLIAASYNYMQEPSIGLFESSNLSFLIHPSYFSMYIIFSIIILLNSLFNKKSNRIIKVLQVSLVLIFTVAVFLLSSKMGAISFVLIVLFFLIFQVILKKQYLIGFISLAFLLLATATSFYFSESLQARFNNAVLAVTTDVQIWEVESSAIRKLIWQNAYELIKENPIAGVGTGDIKDELLAKYEAKGMTYAFEKRLNAHNQFLQTAGALGTIGLSILLLCFVLPFYLSIKYKKPIYSCFLLLVFLNFLVESMLETQAGVVFYAFFNSLLFFSLKYEAEKENFKSKFL